MYTLAGRPHDNNQVLVRGFRFAAAFYGNSHVGLRVRICPADSAAILGGVSRSRTGLWERDPGSWLSQQLEASTAGNHTDPVQVYRNGAGSAVWGRSLRGRYYGSTVLPPRTSC